jgi:hypothetical protein
MLPPGMYDKRNISAHEIDFNVGNPSGADDGS